LLAKDEIAHLHCTKRSAVQVSAVKLLRTLVPLGMTQLLHVSGWRFSFPVKAKITRICLPVIQFCCREG
ncbi:MAG: hypothetical protein ABIG63_20820, partial [Chloroflexota bacterium]